MQPSSPTSKQRLNEIARCTNELARLRKAYGLPELGDRIGVTVGECDWLENYTASYTKAVISKPSSGFASEALLRL